MDRRNLSCRASLTSNQHKGYGVLSSALLLLLALPSSAIAQSAGADDFPNLVGVGVGLTPDYSGARSRSLAAAPMFNYGFKNSGRSISVIGPVASFNIIDDWSFNAGPMLRYGPGRSDVDDPVVAQLHDVDATVDVGAFISYGWIGKPAIPWRLRIWAAAFKSLGNEGGASASFNGYFLMPVSRRALLAVGGSLNYLNSDAMNTDYGVTDADSIRSGLPAFHPGGGNNSQDLWLGATFLVTKSWAVGTGVYWQHLTGNAAQSPIVTERGRQDQVSLGAGLAYIWK